MLRWRGSWRTRQLQRLLSAPRTMDQLEQALKAVKIDLSDDVRDELDRIFPGPGGRAPEAYAW